MKISLSTFIASSALSASMAVTAMVTSAPAQAFQVTIEPTFGSTENTGASALLDFNFSQFADNQVKLNLDITNTTDGSKGLKATEATLVGLAFDADNFDPGAPVSFNNYDSGTSGFTKLWVKGIDTPSLPPYGDFDVAISPPRNTFAGGNPQTGLTAGQFTTVSFLFDTSLSADELSDALEKGFLTPALRIAGRFQQVNAGGGSDKVLGGIIKGGEPVPEPTTIAASLLALGGLGLFKKKFQHKQAVSIN
ncbi:PEP-CTERM sorting domain-containing protein [Calothrix sp. FACHB-1219]|uniref:PEP-CTERM sorting domain-containing protein n=1 Tax=unclassified Calothrix TaxID=2619626 RepID=UPI001681FFFF|nr:MULTISPECIES: PEP-CTERM sorting domain-containing protein [unclassified Calothrix]MBD2202194.1 PEP-CTERM sorting domain-containing protein [Calothrix sp. FACHB-168]MBD2217601.1 PEP-CTERM sorting domain-containing protein [Calothrix sp. FACHB-1219]